MKKIFFLLAMALIVLSANHAAAQSQSYLHDTKSTLVKTGRTYMLGTTPLTQKQVGRLYEVQCPAAFKKYQSAQACTIAGATMVALGGLEIAGITACYKALNAKKRTVAYSVGAVATGTGLIVMLCAPLKYGKAVDIYNERHQRAVTLIPSLGADGVGLAMQW